MYIPVATHHLIIVYVPVADHPCINDGFNPNISPSAAAVIFTSSMYFAAFPLPSPLGNSKTPMVSFTASSAASFAASAAFFCAFFKTSSPAFIPASTPASNGSSALPPSKDKMENISL